LLKIVINVANMYKNILLFELINALTISLFIARLLQRKIKLLLRVN